MFKILIISSLISLATQVYSQVQHQKDHVSYYPALINGENTCMMQMPIQVGNSEYSYHYLISAITLSVLSNNVRIIQPTNWYSWLAKESQAGDQIYETQRIDNYITQGIQYYSPIEFIPNKKRDESHGKGRVVGFYNTNNNIAKYDNDPAKLGVVNKTCHQWKKSTNASNITKLSCGAIVLDFHKLNSLGLDDNEIMKRALVSLYSILKSVLNTRKGQMGALFKIKNLPASINSVYINGREIKLGELESANEVYTSWDLTHGRLKALEDFLYQYQILKNDCAGELTLYNN